MVAKIYLMSFYSDKSALDRYKMIIERNSKEREDVVVVMRDLVKRQRGEIYADILDDISWFDFLRLDEYDMFHIFFNYLSLSTRGKVLKYIFLQSPDVAKHIAKNDNLYRSRAISKKEFACIVNLHTRTGINTLIKLINYEVGVEFEEFTVGEGEKLLLVIRPMNVTDDEWRRFDAAVNKYRAELYGEEKICKEDAVCQFKSVEAFEEEKHKTSESESDDYLLEQLLSKKLQGSNKNLEE